ncbi:IS66 family insertion sequence element accessory protein TnpA [Ferrovum myxofaciens]|uniref:IS66 family insertion sequence element accessory protein TnpA n=2 Tax=Ferrovum myxofaciens TaxID=416213 RepID=UPI003EB82642
METKRSRRIRHSRQDWQGFVSEFLTGGQDCKSFCRDKGLNPSRLIRWQGVFRNEISPAISQMQPVGFLDLGTLPAPEPQPRTGILELKLDLGGGVVLTLTRN